jgi:hypothetical protein
MVINGTEGSKPLACTADNKITHFITILQAIVWQYINISYGVIENLVFMTPCKV